ncbi:hypothetical protein [Mesorhizobium sp.]|uniref:hypothetical protein n=1 Tax=Mesorhizobium sp. TaxID=1871066 RepID=UPI00257E07D2|nr:hypothetical protein [Mesorhizobium sp.]
MSVASFINLGYFDFGRKAPWLWFLVYLASVAVSGLFLWRARARPSAKGVTLNCMARLHAGGIGDSWALWRPPVAVSPDIRQHLAMADRCLPRSGLQRNLPRRCGRHISRLEKRAARGTAGARLGAVPDWPACHLGIVITDAAVHRIDWTASWLTLFGWIGVSGVFKLYAASRYFSSQSAS